jgi:hypothetical protein
MTSKKIKRFREGGVSDKDSGLKASKGEKVGFFERLRMGNIDDEGSEAYRRFGAGRGKAERTPVKDIVATPTAKKAAPVASAGATVTPIPVSPAKTEPKPDQQGSGQTFGQAFAAARKAGNKTFTFKGKSFTTETKEDVAKRKTAAAKKRDDADFAAESARDKTTRSVAGSPNTTQNRAATQKDANTSATKRSIKDAVDRATQKNAAKKQIMRGENPSAEEIEAAKKQIMRGENPSAEDIAKAKKQIMRGTNINYENTDSYDMSMKRGGKVKAYAKGGMTRGDGICVKGKTKGKFV